MKERGGLVTNKARQRVTSLFVSAGVGDQTHPPQFHFRRAWPQCSRRKFQSSCNGFAIERIRSAERELIDLD